MDDVCMALDCVWKRELEGAERENVIFFLVRTQMAVRLSSDGL